MLDVCVGSFEFLTVENTEPASSTGDPTLASARHYGAGKRSAHPELHHAKNKRKEIEADKPLEHTLVSCVPTTIHRVPHCLKKSGRQFAFPSRIQNALKKPRWVILPR